MPVNTVAYWAVIAFIFGAIIGSFLNVVVWRLPRGESLAYPGSHCPYCGHSLSALENIPLISFLLLGAKCKKCRHAISRRYFLVELFTAVLFLLFFIHFGPNVQTIAYCLFSSALIAAFFIDWELFIIPDELNFFALFVAIALDVWFAMHGEAGHSLLWGWLPRSIGGAMVFTTFFILIQLLGRMLFGRDSMGDGDVKLARAIGAMLPIGLAAASFFLAIASGALIGGGMVLYERLRSSKSAMNEDMTCAPQQDADEEPSTLTQILLYGLAYVFFIDVIIQIAAWLRIPAARRFVEVQSTNAEEENEFIPGPTHIPFGPYMVTGFFLAVFFGDKLINIYLRMSGLG